MQPWTIVAPAVGSAFLASTVEIVEAFTIVFAAATVRGWRPALIGCGWGLAVLAIIVVLFAPVLSMIPLQALQFAIGVLLLLFGLRWLRKAILRAAGVIPLHNETQAFDREANELRASAARGEARLDWFVGIAAFKAVVLEGLEVVFIVLAVGAGNGLILPASLGAAAATVLVLVVGMLVRAPLSRVPENTLKFCVGVMLSAFGMFWTGESLGVDWPGRDAIILAFAIGLLALGMALVAIIKSQRVESAL